MAYTRSSSQESCSLAMLYFMNWSIVSGEANFVMDQTSLTVGGFTQPAVA